MHCSRLVWNRTAEINFGLRPKFGLRLKSQTKLLVWDFSLRPKLSVTLLFALIRSQTGCLVSDQGLKLWFQRKIKWPTCYKLVKSTTTLLTKHNYCAITHTLSTTFGPTKHRYRHTVTPLFRGQPCLSHSEQAKSSQDMPDQHITSTFQCSVWTDLRLTAASAGLDYFSTGTDAYTSVVS